VNKDIKPGSIALIIKEHQASYPDPLIVKTGDELTVGKGDSQWSAFVWCTNQNGKSGWVPERHLDRQGDRGVALQDYSTAELTITVGEKVTLEKEDSGWYWVTNQTGKSGWVPVENVAIGQSIRSTPWFVWAALGALFIFAIALTMVSNWQLTGETPNLQSHILLPLLTILGTAVLTFGIARFLKYPLNFSQTLTVIAGASILLQFAAIIEKGIYGYVWQYPGTLYFVFNFLLWLALVVYGFVRWARLRWQTALTLAFLGFLGGLLAAGVIISLTGLSSLGS
jgi:hypothetical protein